MKKSYTLLFVLFLFITAQVFGQTEEFSETELEAELENEAADELAAEIETGPEQTGGIAANEHYLKSVRLTQAARDAYEEGDYEASSAYAVAAGIAAALSDEYVAMRLAENAFAKAHSRYTWAGSVNAASRYRDQYSEAGYHYDKAVEAKEREAWDEVREASEVVLLLLAIVRGPDGQEPPGPGDGVLPAQYTVRLWRNSGDCFSAIAGWSWVYGDVTKWRILYEANKDKLPNPENPHLIIPGMVIDIPSIRGESRQGMWDPASYGK
jgi:hypothetical protein